MMRAIAIPVTILGWLTTGLSGPVHAQPAPYGGPCDQIVAACTQMGFVPRGARAGFGLERDCIRPIMEGRPQPPQAALPLPRIRPRIIMACRASNPNFGTGPAMGRAPGMAPGPGQNGGPPPNGAGADQGGPDAGPGPNGPDAGPDAGGPGGPGGPDTGQGPEGPGGPPGAPGPAAGPGPRGPLPPGAGRAGRAPCDVILMACQQAGFMAGGARSGLGLQADCVRPIMAGGLQPPRAAQPLPRINPRIVEACRASDPSFGQGRAARSGRGGAGAAPGSEPGGPPESQPDGPPPEGSEPGGSPPPGAQPVPHTL
jgi:hypothetical protein